MPLTVLPRYHSKKDLETVLLALPEPTDVIISINPHLDYGPLIQQMESLYPQYKFELEEVSRSKIKISLKLEKPSKQAILDFCDNSLRQAIWLEEGSNSVLTLTPTSLNVHYSWSYPSYIGELSKAIKKTCIILNQKYMGDEWDIKKDLYKIRV